MSNKTFNIGRVTFSQDRCAVIAEAGVNHLGDMNLARDLVEAAARAGADIIKFQTYKAEKLTRRDAPRFWNWEGETDSEGSQFDSYSQLDAFGIDEYRELKKICDEVGIEFMSTPFDKDAVDLLVEVGVQGFKIASCDITNFALLEHVATKGLPVLLSTGASEISEIREAVELLDSNGLKDILIMHCTLTYPTPPEDTNLSAILQLREEFPTVLVGFSDHTLGYEIGAAGTLFGSAALEKHFTVDKSLPLSADHWLSLDEADLTECVRMVRLFEFARGDGKKRVLESEKLARSNARRSLVYSNNFPTGHIVTAASFTEKRPGTGISPSQAAEFLGRTLKRSVGLDDFVEVQDFE